MTRTPLEAPAKPRRASWLPRFFGRAEDFALMRWLFLRLLGLIYVFAFLSLVPQITGLIGSRGLLPVQAFMAALPNSLGSGAVARVPTLLWLNQSDNFLQFLCIAGVVLAVLVVIDVLTLPSLIGLWVLYLSLFYGGQDFLGFQWDVLLLETGFLAIFFAPLQLWPRPPSAPPLSVVWLLRLLLFRLMFGSGMVKLASGDPTWRDLTATAYHYQTQPLPTPLGWYIHHLPTQFHKLEVAFTFLIELVVPFLIFAPRRLRLVGAALLATLQVLIMLTGNYAFFNWLTLVLCVTLLDDAFLRRLFPRSWPAGAGPLFRRATPLYRQVIGVAFTVLMLTLNAVQLSRVVRWPLSLPAPLLALEERLAPYVLVNSYGLFATMTTQRREIVLEGSVDGATWVPYSFRAKPGDPKRAPTWVAPYQPRLDWQMWFAALQESPAQSPWIASLVLRLLQGEPQVLRLLDHIPFPVPPRYVRAQLYDYVYPTLAEHRATGEWWKRQLIGEYFPPVSLDDLR